MLVQIDYNLSFATSFHLGTGIREGLIDRTVIRDKSGYLYVPASTFKGVLREHCEQLLHFYTSNDQERVASPHNSYAALGEFGGRLTLISRIFGSSFYPGRLRFNDARQESRPDDVYKAMQTSISTQVRIDRVTRTAANEALYSSEFGTRDLTFTGSIKGQLDCTPIPSLSVTGIGYSEEAYILMPTYSLLLLLAGLLMVERLGGNKSTGKGQCNCTVTELTLDRHECPEEQWQSWIEHLDVLSGYGCDEKGV
jgi:CRISPR/Cas system CMR subunit Cmr4 (Cas7 group RAMP superfamily)